MLPTNDQLNAGIDSLIRLQNGFKETFIVCFDRQLKKVALFRESTGLLNETMHNGRKRYKVIE